MLLQQSIKKLMRGENLDESYCQDIIEELFLPTTNPLHVAAFLVLLRRKGETAKELFAMVNVLHQKMVPIFTPHKVIDIVGTGGDGQNTINISTGSAILAASCGIKIAKHGNRSVSSLTGSADVLEALGINIELTPDKISKSIDQIGIGFCYSPLFHPAIQAFKRFRKELGVPTTFNYLGPLLNPIKNTHLILGVADAALLSTMAEVLRLMNGNKSIVIHGMGLDEISCLGPFNIIEIDGQKKTTFTIDPKEFGLSYCKLVDLQGGDVKKNAQLLLDTFKGKKGAISNTLILNAAIALYIYGRHTSISEAIICAKEHLASGAALTLLNNWIEFSHAE